MTFEDVDVDMGFRYEEWKRPDRPRKALHGRDDKALWKRRGASKDSPGPGSVGLEGWPQRLPPWAVPAVLPVCSGWTGEQGVSVWTDLCARFSFVLFLLVGTSLILHISYFYVRQKGLEFACVPLWACEPSWSAAGSAELRGS